MILNKWEIIIVLLSAISLGIDLKEHGEPKTGYNNVWSHIISICITYFLMYKAGLFQGK